MRTEYQVRLALTAVLLLSSGAVIRADGPATQPVIRVPHSQLKKLAWQLAVPGGTFTDKSVLEVIDLLHAHDIHHLQLAPGQAVSAELGGVRVSDAMPDAAWTVLQAKLKSVHMDIVSYGPVEFGTDNQSNRNVFQFAKKIKARTIIASVAGAKLDSLDKLATESGVNVAIADADYKSPDDVSAALTNRSNRVGCDGDLSGWGDQTKALQTLNGRIILFRIRDVNAAVLVELKKQAFKGVVTIEVTPGSGPAVVDRLVNSVNRLADALAGEAN